jgi:hypothetical protein
MKTFEIVQEKGGQTISVTSWGCQLISRFSGFFNVHDVFFGSFDSSRMML